MLRNVKVEDLVLEVEDQEGNVFFPELRLVETAISNLQLIRAVDEDHDFDKLMGVFADHGERVHLVGDQVMLTGDCYGYVAPGLKPGPGTITKVCKDDTDHFFGIQMDDGSFGFVKEARIR